MLGIRIVADCVLQFSISNFRLQCEVIDLAFAESVGGVLIDRSSVTRVVHPSNDAPCRVKFRSQRIRRSAECATEKLLHLYRDL